ncbi:type IVB secretion system protein IcmH/DotU [Pseudomonas viridiflava]|uniref:type IVB secretion system protein IcmH/DotU n=1 Tax=Pseudomonas viridiflava TaxID=33069 RepID=UPI000F056949|nr:type IVB secretion system protein IcmH/DotU [Pseudomonas viridiflava]
MTLAQSANACSASNKPKINSVPQRNVVAYDELETQLRVCDDFASARLPASHNPLVSAASRLLSNLARLKPLEDPDHIKNLRSRLAKRIVRFTRQASRAGADAKTVKVASYLLCTVADEAVLTSDWGSESDWANNSLLHEIHDEASGGVRFFQWLEHYMRLASNSVELLELMYLCLALGYQGRYAAIEHGDKELLRLRHALFQCIQRQRGEIARNISRVPLPQRHEQRRQVLLIPGWIPLMLTLFSLTLVYSAFVWMLDQQREKALIPFQQFDALSAGPGIV